MRKTLFPLIIILALGCATPRTSPKPTPTATIQQTDAIEKAFAILGTPPAPSPVIHGKIKGDFNGWTGQTIFELTTGAMWQQTTPDQYEGYQYRPEVTIILQTNGTWLFAVANVDRAIQVVPYSP